MTGRPPLYSRELADRVLQELTAHRSLTDICSDPGMPSETTVRQWVVDDIDGFASRYHEAREIGGQQAGRPSRFTTEVGRHITTQMTIGRDLEDVCTDPGMPPVATVRQWILDDPEGFRAQYKAALEVRQAVSGRRVTPYPDEVLDRALHQVMEARTLRAISKDPGMPSVSTMYLWIKHDYKGFRGRYKEACEIGALVLADELLDAGRDSSKDRIERRGKDGEIETVVDHDHIGRVKIHCDNLKWTLSRVLPKIYGDRVDVNATHEVGDSWAELLKTVNNQSRGLPNQYRLPPPDESEGE